ncbi:restriction endonuclease subunit S [Prosthecodimorpha staleyi]|uniref:Restriction endonuclease subunit S n=1 Tax=Prosthecodimorpha staleyi TaxID=2840188 RepID=A0A947D0N2_9HYPH|nr:restriction endonuclease subunit S [Prosthecodimorpha staleyi]MBT9288763.1 restriction endonuclease subunit S [Prosthecodimorpha staleyi]
MRHYPHIKDSGIEWLGHVPAHWGVLCLKRCAQIFASNVDKKSHTDQIAIFLCNYVDVYYNDMITRNLVFMEATASEDQIDRFSLKAGDTIITKDSESPDDIAIPAYVPETLDGVVCGYHLAIVRPVGEVVGRFIKWLFLSAYCKATLGVRANGLTRFGLGQYALDNFKFAVPPASEQIAIAAFLDRETAKIDALVAEQERLIALLAEKRRAVISHAVTKGLDPNAPMKDSGIPWLGEVPAHWEVAAVGYRYEVQLGKMLDTARQTHEHLRPYLRVQDVQWGSINIEDLPSMDFDEDARKRYCLLQGDLLVNEGGSYVGRSAVWRGELAECYYQKALHRLRPISQLSDDPWFMFYVMIFATEIGVFIAGGNQTTIDHLTAESLRAYRFPFPGLAEQRLIVTWLDRETAKLDELTAEAERGIALLKERRAALISAAVTGKIDVREAVSGEEIAA